MSFHGYFSTTIKITRMHISSHVFHLFSKPIVLEAIGHFCRRVYFFLGYLGSNILCGIYIAGIFQSFKVDSRTKLLPLGLQNDPAVVFHLVYISYLARFVKHLSLSPQTIVDTHLERCAVYVTCINKHHLWNDKCCIKQLYRQYSC